MITEILMHKYGWCDIWYAHPGKGNYLKRKFGGRWHIGIWNTRFDLICIKNCATNSECEEHLSPGGYTIIGALIKSIVKSQAPDVKGEVSSSSKGEDGRLTYDKEGEKMFKTIRQRLCDHDFEMSHRDVKTIFETSEATIKLIDVPALVCKKCDKALIDPHDLLVSHIDALEWELEKVNNALHMDALSVVERGRGQGWGLSKGGSR